MNAITITPNMTTGALFSRLDSVCFALLANTRFFAAAVHQHRASEKGLVSFSCEGLEVIVETAPGGHVAKVSAGIGSKRVPWTKTSLKPDGWHVIHKTEIAAKKPFKCLSARRKILACKTWHQAISHALSKS